MVAPITEQELKSLLTYCPNTGEFRWKVSRNGFVQSGRLAGSKNSSGYVVIMIHKKSQQAHRLAWLYMTGEWPILDIDHADMNKTNNKWENLRQATRAQNISNRGVGKNNSLGIKGVSYHKVIKKYTAQLRHNRKIVFQGYFKTAEEARDAYNAAAKAVYGEFARSE